MRRRKPKSRVKYGRSTVAVPPILGFLSPEEASGTGGVAVKCIEITRNTGGEGD